MKWDNFTAARIASFRCQEGKGQSIYWDGKTPGLGVRVTAGGAKSFIFESALHGKTIRITIGDAKTWTIPDAQARATAYKQQIDGGRDPRQIMADERAAAEREIIERAVAAEAALTFARRHAITLADAWPKYVDNHKSKWSAGHLQNHYTLTSMGGETKKRGNGLTVPGPMAPLMPLRLADLTAEKIAIWLESAVKSRPTNAAQSYRLLRAFIRWAADVREYSALIPGDAYSSKRVKDALPKNRAAEGDGLQREMLKTWFCAVQDIGNPVIAAYLQGLLLTGARREELACLKWEDVDFQWQSMTIKDKVEGTRTIPLTPFVAQLISALPRRNEFVYSSRSASGYIEEPRIAHTKALASAGLPHVSLQGLRRSFGTLCEWIEMPSGISAQIMGHKPSALAEKHYRRRPLDLLRMWHVKIEAWMLEQAEIEFSPTLTRLRKVDD